MTKLSKSEKILRKGNEKWKNFLAEGAFKKTVTEWDEDDTYHFDQDKHSEPEEYTAAANFKMGDVVKVMARADDRYNKYDEPEELRCRVGTVTGMDGKDLTLKFENGEEATITYFNAARDESGLWNSKSLYNCPEQVSEVDLSKQEDDEFQYNQAQKEEEVNEARMGEYGKIDAEDGNPPTKIGRGNEEYMAAYNAVLQARGEEPLDIQQPDQAYLDALQQGRMKPSDHSYNLKEVVDKRARQLLSEGLTPEQVKEKILEEGFGDFIRKGADFVKAKTGLGRTTKTRELYNKMKFEKDKYFEFRDKFYPNAKDVRNFMEFVEQNARKQGGGSGGMMSDLAYRAISKEKFKTMDSPITYLKQARKISSNIEKMMLDGAVDQKGDKTFKVIRDMAESIVKDFEQARAYLKGLSKAIKAARKSGSAQALKDIYKDQVEHERYLNQKQARADKAFAAKAKEAERQARKDKPKDDEDIIRGKSTQRFGLATNLEENEKKKFEVGEFVYIVNGSLKGASGKILEPVTTTTGEEGFAIELYSAADKRVFGQRGDEVIALAGDLESGGTTDDMELYDIDEKKNLKEEVIEDFEIELEGGITFADVEEAGLVTPGVDSVIDNGDGYAQVYSEPEAMAKMAKTLEAMTGVMVTPKSHGVVDERSKDDERDLEEPVKYGSGAELEWDAKAQKFYDRKRDMYIDDKEEEDNLTAEKNLYTRTTHSSDPEMDQVMDIAADMLELSARSRIPVNLKSVQSALEAQSFDAKMEKGMLIVDDKYVIADKKSLPASAQKITFTNYAADYLSNLQGEQQNLPIG